MLRILQMSAHAISGKFKIPADRVLSLNTPVQWNQETLKIVYILARLAKRITLVTYIIFRYIGNFKGYFSLELSLMSVLFYSIVYDAFMYRLDTIHRLRHFKTMRCFIAIQTELLWVTYIYWPRRDIYQRPAGIVWCPMPTRQQQLHWMFRSAWRGSGPLPTLNCSITRGSCSQVSQCRVWQPTPSALRDQNQWPAGQKSITCWLLVVITCTAQSHNAIYSNGAEQDAV